MGDARPLRVSSYSILSEPLPGGGFALMNGSTGAIDLVSDEVAAVFVQSGGMRGAQGTPFDVPEAVTRAFSFERKGTVSLDPETARNLAERGHLTTRTAEEEEDHVRNVAEMLHDVRKPHPIFMIVPNLDCNYRCTYCFERPLQNDLRLPTAGISYSRQNVVMTADYVEPIFQSIARIRSESGNTDETGGQIVLYGGEPLDRKNRDVVSTIVRRGVELGFDFAAISNGHDWEAYLDLMGDGGLRQIQVSIDGPRHVHDKRRIHVGGGSSFDKILENIDRVLARGGTQVQIRVHVDPSNIELFEEVLETCASRNWLNHPWIVVYANTVYAKEKTHGHVEARIANGEIIRRLREVAAPYRNVFVGAPSVNARMQIMDALGEGIPYRLNSTYCAANSGNYIFAPDGHMYACWESVGKECSRVGSYMEGGLRLDPVASKRWFSRSVAVIPECQKCPYALVCGGGCAQYAEYNTGTLYKPFCDDFESIFRIALAENVEEYVQVSARGATLPQQAVSLHEFWKSEIPADPVRATAGVGQRDRIRPGNDRIGKES
jgi:uncharacterized protein